MELVRILPGNPDIERLDAINLEAFPARERLDMSLQARLCGEGSLDLLGIYDAGALVGFTTVLPCEGIDYVFFLAVDPATRSKGYGARTLSLLSNRYEGDCIVLDIEPTGTGAPDEDMRQRRRNFYLRNSFASSGYLLTYCGQEFEVLYSGRDSFDRKAYEMTLRRIEEILVAHGITGFDPVLVKI